MSEIIWEIHDPNREKSKIIKSNKPTITISPNGKFSFNKSVCDLIPDVHSYSYIDVYKGIVDDKLQKLKLVFTNDKKENSSIEIRRDRHVKGYTGIAFYSFHLARKIGADKTRKVYVDSSYLTDNNTIVFALNDIKSI